MIRKDRQKWGLAVAILLIAAGCSNSNTEVEPKIQATEPPALPTASPTPEVEYDTPSFYSIPGQIMLPGEEILSIDLTEYLYRADPAIEDVIWSAESDPVLSVSFNGPIMQVERSSPAWPKSNVIQIEACNPGNKCGHTDIDLTVIGTVDHGIFHTQVDGILIESGGTKIMIDALFNNPEGTNNPKILLAMREAAPPYDQVDLILITHHHADHFDAEITVQYMIHNPEALLLSTDMVVGLLAEEAGFDQIADRVTGLQAEPGMDEIVNIAGLEIEVIYLSHANLEEVPNFGYIFTIEEKTFFHTGDVVLDDEPLSTFIDYGLPDKGINYAFVPYFMLTRSEYFPYATEGIAPEFLVPVHVSTRDKSTGSLFETMGSNFANLLPFNQDFYLYSFDHD